MKYQCDVVIIGAGPVGLYAATQAGMLGMKAIIVDALDEVGGQLNALYPEKYIYDIPGYYKIKATDLVTNLIEQLSPYGVEFLLEQQITSLSTKDLLHTVDTTAGHCIESKAIVIAAGAGAFKPNRPDVDNLELYEASSVFYSIKDIKKFTGKRVVIAGGGDSAIDWAIELSAIAKKVHLVHRRDNFRAIPVNVERIRELSNTDKLDLVIPYMPRKILGNNGIMSSIELSTIDESSKQTIDADYFLPFYGLARTLGSISEWNLDINSMKSTIKVNRDSCETNVNSVYAVGDVAEYNGKLKIISTGFADVVYALHHAWKYVFPDKKFKFQHSTAKGE